MIDRTLLTEALAEYDRGEGRMLDGWATEILVIVEVARWARDFPTDKQVEAAALAFAGLDSWDEDLRERSHRKQWRAQARAALEAAAMIGDNQ